MPQLAGFICTDAAEATPRGNLTTVAEALAFMNAGNATFTLQSRTTGQRFTYRMRASEDGQLHFVALLNGSDNETSYAYIGYVRRGVYFHGGAKSRVQQAAPSNLGFAWVWRHLAQATMPATVAIWHEGRCGRCARKLTVPASIASGIGPECASRIGL